MRTMLKVLKLLNLVSASGDGLHLRHPYPAASPWRAHA